MQRVHTLQHTLSCPGLKFFPQEVFSSERSTSSLPRHSGADQPPSIHYYTVRKQPKTKAPVLMRAAVPTGGSHSPFLSLPSDMSLVQRANVAKERMDGARLNSSPKSAYNRPAVSLVRGNMPSPAGKLNFDDDDDGATRRLQERHGSPASPADDVAVRVLRRAHKSRLKDSFKRWRSASQAVQLLAVLQTMPLRLRHTWRRFRALVVCNMSAEASLMSAPLRLALRLWCLVARRRTHWRGTVAALVALFRRQTLHSGMAAWQHVWQRTSFSSAIRRRRDMCQKAGCLLAWTRFYDRRRRVKSSMRRGRKLFRRRELGRSLTIWCTAFSEVEKKGQLVRQGSYLYIRQKLTTCFEFWLESVVCGLQGAALGCKVSHVLDSRQRKVTSSAWERWLQEVSRISCLSLLHSKAERRASTLRTKKLSVTLILWSRWASNQRMCRSTLNDVHKRRFQELSSAFVVWTRNRKSEIASSRLMRSANSRCLRATFAFWRRGTDALLTVHRSLMRRQSSSIARAISLWSRSMSASASVISRMNTAMRTNAHTRLSTTWARWYRRAHGVRQANRLCLDRQMHWVVERWTQWKLLATHTLRINNALVRGAHYFVHKKLSLRFGEWAMEARAGGKGLLAMRCADSRLLSSLEHSFRLWRQRASKLVIVHCTSVQLLRQSAARAMQTWVAVASAHAYAARLAHRAVARMVSQQLASGLSCWASRADETRHRQEMMSHGLSRMANRALSTGLASWVWRIESLAEMQRQLDGAISQLARGRQLSALRLWRAEACVLFSARALATRWMLASSKCALAVWKSVATEWMQTEERAQVAAALMLNRHLLAHWTQWKLHAAITLRTKAALVHGAQYFVHKQLSARFEAWATEARAGGKGVLAMRCSDDRLLSSLEHSFRLWRRHASTLVTVHCTSVQLLRQSAAHAMQTWVAVASARARAARLAHRAVARMVSQQLASGLSCWASRADETRHRQEMMSHGLSRMANRALSTGLASWVWRIESLAEMQRQLDGAISQLARGRQLSALRLWRAEACVLFSARALATRWMLASSKCALAVWKSVATEWMQTEERAQVAAALMLNRHLLAHWTQWKLHAASALRAHATLVSGAQYWVQQRLSARFEAWATEARAGGTGLRAMRIAYSRLVVFQRQAFRLWRRHASTLVTVHCTTAHSLWQSATHAMRTWMAIASARLRLTRLADVAMARSVSQHLAAGFARWISHVADVRAVASTQHRCLQDQARLSVSHCFQGWLKESIKSHKRRQAAMHMRTHVEEACLSRWRQHVWGRQQSKRMAIMASHAGRYFTAREVVSSLLFWIESWCAKRIRYASSERFSKYLSRRQLCGSFRGWKLSCDSILSAKRSLSGARSKFLAQQTRRGWVIFLGAMLVEFQLQTLSSCGKRRTVLRRVPVCFMALRKHSRSRHEQSLLTARALRAVTRSGTNSLARAVARWKAVRRAFLANRNMMLYCTSFEYTFRLSKCLRKWRLAKSAQDMSLGLVRIGRSATNTTTLRKTWAVWEVFTARTGSVLDVTARSLFFRICYALTLALVHWHNQSFIRSIMRVAIKHRTAQAVSHALEKWRVAGAEMLSCSILRATSISFFNQRLMFRGWDAWLCHGKQQYKRIQMKKRISVLQARSYLRSFSVVWATWNAFSRLHGTRQALVLCAASYAAQINLCRGWTSLLEWSRVRLAAQRLSTKTLSKALSCSLAAWVEFVAARHIVMNSMWRPSGANWQELWNDREILMQRRKCLLQHATKQLLSTRLALWVEFVAAKHARVNSMWLLGDMNGWQRLG